MEDKTRGSQHRPARESQSVSMRSLEETAMPDYLAPGVYVEETRSGPKPIAGVASGTAGMVGPTERGPTRPRLVTTWAEYLSYGTPKPNCSPFAVTKELMKPPSAPS